MHARVLLLSSNIRNRGVQPRQLYSVVKLNWSLVNQILNLLFGLWRYLVQQTKTVSNTQLEEI